jgi:predicted nucleic-acid-binding protein
VITPDTNVIIRLLVRDDETQFAQAHRLFQEKVIFIPTTVVLETEWVLRYAYEFEPDTIIAALRGLFGLPNVELEQPLHVAQALAWREAGLDFADALHLAAAENSQKLVTFDKKLANRAKKVTNFPVELV